MIRAGTLDRKIEIVTAVNADDSGIGEVNTHVNSASYTVNATVWASVRDVAGNETFTGDRTKAERTIAFIIRYSTLPTEKHFVRYNSDIYAIERIEEMGRKEGLMLVATKVSK